METRIQILVPRQTGSAQHGGRGSWVSLSHGSFYPDPPHWSFRCIANVSLEIMALLPRRFLIVALLCLVMILLKSMGTNVGVAFQILALPSSEAGKMKGKDFDFLKDDIFKPSSWTSAGLSWSHAAFYLGYFGFHLLAGWTTTKFAADRMIGFTVFLSCALNLLIPIFFAGDFPHRIY